MNSENLPDCIIVTGAGRGLGKYLAAHLAEPDRQILCISKSLSCNKTALEIQSQGFNSAFIQLDLADYKHSYCELIKWLAGSKPKKIGIVAAAGILGPQGPFKTSDLDEWDKTFRVNLLGNLAVVQAALPIMEKENYGRIVMFAGGGSAYAYPVFPAYSASKTAIVRTVENLAEDFKEKNISITCLAPGAIETDMLAQVRAANAPISRIGKIEDVLNSVQALLSAKTTILSGRFLHVRDNWQEVLCEAAAIPNVDHWKLRRVE